MSRPNYSAVRNQRSVRRSPLASRPRSPMWPSLRPSSLGAAGGENATRTEREPAQLRTLRDDCRKCVTPPREGGPVDSSWRVRREGSVPAALSSKSRGDARFRRARLAYSGIQSTPPVMTTWSVALMDTSLPRGCDGAATPLRQGRSAPPRGRLAVACTGKPGSRPGRGWGRPCE
jgi:hypothetical protein